jgi:hypothetical protein
VDRKKKVYWTLFVITSVFTLAGLLTLIPRAAASRECALGYRALCAYTPASTGMCLTAALMACIIRRREFKD